jgi:hypothetical protein
VNSKVLLYGALQGATTSDPKASGAVTDDRATGSIGTLTHLLAAAAYYPTPGFRIHGGLAYSEVKMTGLVNARDSGLGVAGGAAYTLWLARYFGVSGILDIMYGYAGDLSGFGGGLSLNLTFN